MSVSVSFCVYLCLCVYVCLCVCPSLCVCMFLSVDVSVCMSVYVYVSMYACVYVYTCLCVSLYVCLYLCMFMYACIYIHVGLCLCVCLYVCMCICARVGPQGSVGLGAPPQPDCDLEIFTGSHTSQLGRADSKAARQRRKIPGSKGLRTKKACSYNSRTGFTGTDCPRSSPGTPVSTIVALVPMLHRQDRKPY